MKMLPTAVRTTAVVLGFAFTMAGLGFGSSAFAGVITRVTMFGANAGTGPGIGKVDVPVVLTVLANNDHVPAAGVLDNNITVPIKRFEHNGIIDIQFVVAPSQGVTEYQVFESVDNNTGVNWSQDNISLGFGVGAAFVPSPANDGLDFDFPNFATPPSSSALPVVALGQDNLNFSGGIHNSGSETYQVRIDVPDLGSLFQGGVFTLRQEPVPVPKPSSILLAVLGSVLVSVCARRRK
jgi:hypothetical protein